MRRLPQRARVWAYALLLAAACDDYPPCGPEENGEWGPGGPNPGPTLPDPSTGASGPDRANVTYSTNDAGEVCECGPYALGCEPTPERAKMARSCRSAGEGRRNCLVGLDDPPAAATTSAPWYCDVTKTRVSTGERRTWTIRVSADDEAGARAEAYRIESADPRYSDVVVERCRPLAN